MEQKLIKLAALTITAFSFLLAAKLFGLSLAKEKENPTIGVFQSDILLNGKKVYRNYPEGDLSYKDWDINASLISSYVDEEFGTLYEDKINDSIIFRKGTNEEYNYVEFWWFRLLSPKDSVYFKSKDIVVRVGGPVEIIQNNFPDMWLLYQEGMENERNREREIQLYTDMWFHYNENSEEYSEGTFMVYVQNGVITRIIINFMLEGDMP